MKQAVKRVKNVLGSKKGHFMQKTMALPLHESPHE
jgi:hypothetical protein